MEVINNIPNAFISNAPDTSYLDKELFDDKKNLKIKDASFYESIPHEHLVVWCHFNGIYGLVTTELIIWLKTQMILNKTIEIGAGNDSIGRELGIPFTDLCIMKNPLVQAMYLLQGQPVTEYPNDIIKMEGSDAIKKYKPDVVIGCWVTQIYKEEDGPTQASSMFGFDEEFIIKNVKKYIVIGNEKVHGTKRILSESHQTLKFPWLFSRSVYPDDNLIYIWEQ